MDGIIKYSDKNIKKMNDSEAILPCHRLSKGIFKGYFGKYTSIRVNKCPNIVYTYT